MKLPNCKKPCNNCPFKKDTQKGWLGKQRITEILSEDSFVCHKKSDLQCAGHMLIKGQENSFVRTANRMGLDTGLKGAELVFDSKEQCIKHHTNYYEPDIQTPR